MVAGAAPVIPEIVQQHLEESTHLRHVRSFLVRAPYVNLFQLSRHDERIRAHLDGLTVAGDAGYRIAQHALEETGVGPMFVLSVAAIERRDSEEIDRLLALLGAVPDAERALVSAFGWVSAESLRGFIAPMLASPDRRQAWLGIAACAAHGVDPGPALVQGIEDPDERLRTRSLRAAGRLGRQDLLNACLRQIEDRQPVDRLQAARSALLLGGSSRAAGVLESVAFEPEPHSLEALQLLMIFSNGERARALVRQLSADGAAPRKAIQAAGWAGDVAAIGWLIRQMEDDGLARVAGEAFTMLTGADLVRLQLERVPSDKVKGGPTDDAEDEVVTLDDDEGLPWPDIARVQAWWDANRSRIPTGVRCFMGAAANEAQCNRVLREGTQRQRAVAALLLALMQPGRVLFNIAAPAWRQQRWLAKLR